MPDPPRTREERHEYGRTLRERAPLESHAESPLGAKRADPLELIEEQNANRLPWLVPVRRVRMAVSPFTFFRGSARIMAADLAQTPNSGLETQICGDAHLSNFGVYASPERRLVFDLNDFDETLPGPWEWDVKRLAASFVLAGRQNGLAVKNTRKLTQKAVRSYRKAMADLAAMRLTDVWYSLAEVDRIGRSVKDREVRDDLAKHAEKVMHRDSRKALDKLAEEVDGQYRIRSEPPYLLPLRDLPGRHRGDEMRDVVLEQFAQYRANVPDHIEHLLGKFRPIDCAIKVVGVGSVGTKCFILLLEGRDREDPLFLQIKQANRSVLEEHLAPSRYETAGRRVVEGQRLMQTVSDIFLGHAATGDDYYWRQLKDWKGSADVDNADRKRLNVLAKNRGRTLARAHARAGDPLAISGYLGGGEAFDRAVVRFAESYADQVEVDHAAFVAQIEAGRLEAAEYA